MNLHKNYESIIESIKGKTIAIVYIFEGEDAPGFSHYHIWKSDVISKWINAVQEIHCMPFILDVRTFVEKAINRTLPYIDFVVNLNCGSTELSPMGLVPSMCGFLGIPCIPCDTMSIITGENKNVSNLIAKASGLNVPKELSDDSQMGIYRPLNYGSSFGVKRVTSVNKEKYNPLTHMMEPLPTIIYLPNDNNREWFFDEKAKETKNGYKREIIPRIDEDLIRKYIKLIENLSIKTFCRIDARISCDADEKIDNISDYILDSQNVYFIEINPMPTVRNGNSFDFSYQSITERNAIFEFINALEKDHKTVSPHGLLLACSMLAYIKAKY